VADHSETDDSAAWPESHAEQGRRAACAPAAAAGAAQPPGAIMIYGSFNPAHHDPQLMIDVMRGAAAQPGLAEEEPAVLGGER
jgi:hypothetical protein